MALVNNGGNSIIATVSTVPVVVTDQGNPTATRTDVARSNASQLFLAANADRKGATIFNDTGAILYVKFGITASSSDFTVRLTANDYYEVPFHYTGRIDGVWASNGAGNALMTEIT